MSESLRELIHALSLIFLGGNFKTFTPLQIFYLVSKLIAANYFFFSADGFAKEFLKNINVANPQVIFLLQIYQLLIQIWRAVPKLKLGVTKVTSTLTNFPLEAYSFLQKNLREHIWIMIFFVQVRAPFLARKA